MCVMFQAPNILISSRTAKYPVAKITDFGLSKIIRNHAEKIRTLCGTLYYKPPELIVNFSLYTANPRMDVGSLGVLLFYM